MSQPSVHSLVCDLLGEDPYQARPPRPTVREAARLCGPGQVRAARHRGHDVAVFRLTDGRAFRTPDHCPHDGGPLSDGFVEGHSLVCARHGWEFDGCSGQCPTRSRVRIEVTPVE